jgi:hypothetical protein
MFLRPSLSSHVDEVFEFDERADHKLGNDALLLLENHRLGLGVGARELLEARQHVADVFDLLVVAHRLEDRAELFVALFLLRADDALHILIVAVLQ